MAKLWKYVSMSSCFGSSVDKNTSNAELVVKPSSTEKVLVFDIDYTLYWSKDMAEYEMSSARKAFVRKKLEASDMSSESAAQMFDAELRNGTHFCEIFCSHFGMEPDDFFSDLDIFDYSKYIARDERLVEWMRRLSGRYRLFAMSNACDRRAREILSILGIEDFFEFVFCAHIMGSGSFNVNPLTTPEDKKTEMVYKPKQGAYLFVQKYIGVSKPSQIVLFDDSKRNCDGAIKAGWIVFPIKQFLETPSNLEDSQSDPSITNQLFRYIDTRIPQVN